MALNESSDADVQCTRCRNKHFRSARVPADLGDGRTAWVCPRCRGKSYHDIRPQAAWCWASGLIEMDDVDKVPAGAILVATGPKAFLAGAITALARLGQGESAGTFLVPGVPEAESQSDKGDALARWLTLCARRNGRQGGNGVQFVTPAY